MKIDQARFIPFEVPTVRIRLIICYFLYKTIFGYKGGETMRVKVRSV